MNPSFSALPLAAALLVLLPTPGAAAVVVTEVTENGVAARAGIEVGDRLVAWSADQGSGDLERPFAIDRLTSVVAPYGGVLVEGLRDGEPRMFSVDGLTWGIGVRPDLPPDLVDAWSAARELTGDAGARALAPLADQVDEARIDLLTMAAGLAESQDVALPLFDRAVEAASGDAELRGWIEEKRGAWLFGKGDFEAARSAFETSLRIREETDPGGLLLAQSVNWLGFMAWQRRDLAAAAEHLGHSAEIWSRLVPGSVLDASGQINLGVVARVRGDLFAAEEHGKRALAIFRAGNAEEHRIAAALNNLGVVYDDLGAFDRSEEHFRLALEIRERIDPEGASVVETTNNLGVIAMERSDWEASRSWFQRSLQVARAQNPEGLDVARALANLGIVEQRAGNLDEAERLGLLALAIQRREVPGTETIASTLADLGVLAGEQGEAETAREYFEEALGIRSRLPPDPLRLAYTELELGRVELLDGQIERAQQLFESALANRERLSPGTWRTAQARHLLARCHRVQGRLETAEGLLRQAVLDLEEQQLHLGGSLELLGEFRSSQRDVTFELMDLLVETGRPAEAFTLSERARAGAFLALLAERELVVARLPAELERERRLVNAEWESALDRLASAPEEEQEQARRDLDGVRLRQESVRARIRREAPGRATLRYPEPLDAAAVEANLRPGELLLAWTLGPDDTLLFVVEKGGVRAHSLGIGEEEIRALVGTLRARIGPAPNPVVPRLATALSGRLLGPAADDITQAERLVLAPDGALWQVPFALLPEPTRPGQAASRRALDEDRPMILISSATVAAELNELVSPEQGEVLIWADPNRDPADPRGFGPLPGTREEARALREVWGEQARVVTGAEATKAHFLEVAPEGVLVHLAVHAGTDELFPLESGLALAASPADEGILRSWEILEGLELESELVVLSACGSGLGQTLVGEGVHGLTRSFHAAGARAVVASLWDVPDEATAVLMRAFHEGLREGLAKDVALRRAQRTLAEGPEHRRFRSPFYWAAFQLYGDPRPLPFAVPGGEG